MDLSRGELLPKQLEIKQARFQQAHSFLLAVKAKMKEPTRKLLG